ncbi:asparagine synthase (glutamine-hydrolyzing) [Ferrovibrio sp.]|uniref:asparagine synthase (glutamine-hydrolyzing) n=1 Tax=Ferrovibrio sp. TaxID=1917215 RepID=UPI003D0EBE15
MCGITGFYGIGNINILQAMTDALAHRGPDGEGLYADNQHPVFLGHRRLSIIDIAAGAQPMWSHDRRYCIVFNGEIYNHAELRQELEARGHRFLSDHSDTEALLIGYREWGRAVCDRLNGMFAFCILDLERNCLFLARDRCGEKPLYYAKTAESFSFASELPALLLHPAIDTALDPVGLQKYFAYGYIPAPRTLYKGCSKLKAGGWLELDLATGNLQDGIYWDFRIAPDTALGNRTADSLAEELDGLIRQATARRLMADVPVGIFLSGGIDSSAILANACRIQNPALVKSFTVGFDEPSYDESANAEQVARYFGTDHAVRVLNMAAMGAEAPMVLDGLGEPIVDPSLLPTYFLSKFAREKVTVALTGDGGDELFAGYAPFKALRPGQLYTAVTPPWLHRGLRRLIDLMPVTGGYLSLDFKLRRSLQGLGHPASRRNPAWMAPLAPDLFEAVFLAPLDADTLYSEAMEAWDRAGGDMIDASLDFYTRFYLPENILTKTDRTSMAVSLETRAVFLDNDILAFCQRLPNRHKFAGNTGKVILRKALARLLPPDVLKRPKKGFGIPLLHWLRQYMHDQPPMAADGMSQAGVTRLWQEHMAGKRDHRLFLFGCYALQQARRPAA